MRHGGYGSTDFAGGPFSDAPKRVKEHNVDAESHRTPGVEDHLQKSKRDSENQELPSGFRWLFGEKPSKAERFQGYGFISDGGDDCPRNKTLCLLSKVVRRMKENGSGLRDSNNNRTIPAGYTYLGQLIAHDLVFSQNPIPTSDAVIGKFGNSRTEPLLLQSIYSGDPDTTPWLYEYEGEISPGIEIPRTRFRLGQTVETSRKVGKGERRPFPPVGFDDIARISRENLSDGQLRKNRPESLIGDERNEDNLIISQLTVLFKKLHNKIADTLVQYIIDRSNLDKNYIYLMKKEIFLSSKNIVISIFHNIIAYDYLYKISNKEIYKKYLDNYNEITKNKVEYRKFLIENKSSMDKRIPIEFAMAVFRFGHIMVQDQYIFNNTHGEESQPAQLRRLMEFNPNFSKNVPITTDWVLDEWHRFFFETFSDKKLCFKECEISIYGKNYIMNTSGEVFSKDNRDNILFRVNFSRKISNSVSGELYKNKLLQSDDKYSGGLIYRTLARGFITGLWSGQALAEKIGLKNTGSTIEVVAPDQICTGLGGVWCKKKKQCIATSDDVIVNYDSDKKPKNFALKTKDLNKLTHSTPLFYYILEEARVFEDGNNLGKLGSEIVSQFIFDTLSYQNLMLEIEEEHVNCVFGNYQNKFSMRHGLPTKIEDIVFFVNGDTINDMNNEE